MLFRRLCEKLCGRNWCQTDILCVRYMKSLSTMMMIIMIAYWFYQRTREWTGGSRGTHVVSLDRLIIKLKYRRTLIYLRERFCKRIET